MRHDNKSLDERVTIVEEKQKFEFTNVQCINIEKKEEECPKEVVTKEGRIIRVEGSEWTF